MKHVWQWHYEFFWHKSDTTQVYYIVLSQYYDKKQIWKLLIKYQQLPDCQLIINFKFIIPVLQENIYEKWKKWNTK